MAGGSCVLLHDASFCHPLCSLPCREYLYFVFQNNKLFPQVIFQITPLNYVEWQAVLAFSLPVVVLDEILKACARIYFGKFDFLFFTFKIDTLTFLLHPQGKNHPAALRNRSSISKGELIKIKINFC